MCCPQMLSENEIISELNVITGYINLNYNERSNLIHTNK